MPTGALGQIRPMEAPVQPPGRPDAPVNVGMPSIQLKMLMERFSPPRPAMTGELLLGSLGNPALRLRRPLRIRTEKDGDFVVLSSEELGEFGYGRFMMEAVWDFQKTIASLYFSLKAEQSRLGPDLSTLWRKLREAISER